MKKIITTIALTVSAGSINAALLDRTDIVFSTSTGSGYISGPWSAPPLIIEESSNIEYFTVTLTELTRPAESIGLTSYIYQNSREFAMCWNSASCLIDTYIGASANIDRTAHGEWDFFERLVLGNNPEITSGQVTAYTDFANGPSVTGVLSVEAYGTLAPVPIPAAIWLFGSGLISLIGVARHKKVKWS